MMMVLSAILIAAGMTALALYINETSKGPHCDDLFA